MIGAALSWLYFAPRGGFVPPPAREPILAYTQILRHLESN